MHNTLIRTKKVGNKIKFNPFRKKNKNDNCKKSSTLSLSSEPKSNKVSNDQRAKYEKSKSTSRLNLRLNAKNKLRLDHGCCKIS